MRVVRLLIVVAALVAAVAPVPAAVVERYYSNGLYPRLQPPVTLLSSLVPVALLDITAALVVAAAAAAAARSWRVHGARTTIRRAGAALAVAAAAAYLWFLLFWGLNYRRVPLEDKVAYDASRIARAQALVFGRVAVGHANALAESNGGGQRSEDEALSYAFAAVEGQLRGSAHGSVTLLASPKRSVLQWYFRKAAIDGMTNPFFLEVIVHPDLLPFERPFVLAHEWAHLAGYADESEANFIAWLTCIRATPLARYGGWLSAYQHVAAGLPRDDRRALRAALQPAVIADLTAASQRLALASPRVRTAARGAYDSYLRANRIEEGIANYDAVVRLMLGTTFDAEWTPRRR